MPPVHPTPIDPTVLRPTPQTLAKYGLTLFEWGEMLRRQGGVCAVCKRVPKSKRFVIDHEHVKGWKQLGPGERRRYVRGILCAWCNARFLGSALTIPKALAVVEYLTRYHSKEERTI